MFKFPFLALAFGTGLDHQQAGVLGTTPGLSTHINNMIVSHGAQPWPGPMSFLGARRGHFWVSTRPFHKFNEKSPVVFL